MIYSLDFVYSYLDSEVGWVPLETASVFVCKELQHCLLSGTDKSRNKSQSAVFSLNYIRRFPNARRTFCYLDQYDSDVRRVAKTELSSFQTR